MMRNFHRIFAIFLSYLSYSQCFLQSLGRFHKSIHHGRVDPIPASLKVDPSTIPIPKRSDVDTANKKTLTKVFPSLLNGTMNSEVSFQLLQQTTGLVPRSYLPAALIFQSNVKSEQINEHEAIASLESALQWYFDCGGRTGRLEFIGPDELSSLFMLFGKVTSISKYSQSANIIIPSGYSVWAADAESIINHCKSRLQSDDADKSMLNDIIGRVYHDIGRPVESVEYYTNALQINPSSSATLRNLGSAYQAVGNQQMAFASYQQALEVNPNDHIVYLKLAIFYEEFASRDWMEAAENAEACYRHYLANVDKEDTAIMTRLGNLLVREHKAAEAIDVYNEILAVDSNLHNVWFNKAHAEMKIMDYYSAARSLERTLALDPSIIAAKHMLIALTEDKAKEVVKTDEAYVKELYDSYAQTYDEHGKKLLYSAPRVIRQEMAKIYKARTSGEEYDSSDTVLSPPLKKATMTAMGTCSDHPMEARSNAACVDGPNPTHEHDHSDCSSQPSSVMDRQLDILDLGCGTGLSGAWLKDYAKTLVGVDLSEEMVKVAKKKMVYDNLIVDSIDGYLDLLASSKSDHSMKSFDLVVAVEVLSYIGDLKDTFQRIFPTIRPGGHFVFSADTSNDESELTSRGFKLLKNGRFGYSKAYLDNLVAAAGEQYRILMSRSFSPRLDVGEPVPSYLYIVERQQAQ